MILSFKFPVVFRVGVVGALGLRLATGLHVGRGPLLSVLVGAYSPISPLWRVRVRPLALAAKRFLEVA